MDSMKTHIKNALITTAMVLGTIYLMRQFGPTRAIYQRAVSD
jgi:hypothetical protein